MDNDLLIQALYHLVNAKSVKVRRNENAKRYPLISIKKDGDVGYDLPCTENMIVQPGERKTLPTGIYLEMPDHLWATVEGRSSASRWLADELLKCILDDEAGLSFMSTNDGEATMPRLLVITGVIDTGYRGELRVVVINVGEVPVEIKEGERYGQVIFHFRCTPLMEEVDELAPSERGETGFGSSGR